MSKLKQATLFSLKEKVLLKSLKEKIEKSERRIRKLEAEIQNKENWNKITPEEIMKHKNVLDNQAGIETILKILTTLKKRKPAKDLLLSTGIDASLKKMMTEHHSSLVTNEVKKLLIHWKLDESLKNQDVTVEKEKNSLVVTNFVNKSNNITKTIVVKKSELLNKMENLTKVSETQSKDELSILKVCAKFEEKKEEPKTKTADEIYKMQTEKVICKKPLVSDFRKKEVNRRLQSAIALFMEELGKQEVKMYLDALALKCCDY